MATQALQPKPNRRLVGLRLPDEVIDALQAQADKELASVQQIVRRAVAEYLARLATAA